MGLFGRRSAADFARAYRPRIVVKFKSDVKLTYAVSAEAEFAEAHETTWRSLQRSFPGATLRPYFGTIPRERLESLQAGTARRSGRDPRFTSCFGVTLPSGD